MSGILDKRLQNWAKRFSEQNYLEQSGLLNSLKDKMERRLVWTERVWMGGKAALVSGDHWAVRVGEDGLDCYEVQQEDKNISIRGRNEMDKVGETRNDSE